MLTPEQQQYLEGLLHPTFPCFSSLDEAIQEVNERLSEHSRNEILTGLMTYQNALVNQIIQQLGK